VKSWLALAALAVVVAALGGWLYYKPSARETQTQAVSTLKAGDVKRVRVERTPDVQLALERRDGTWYITEPFKARADGFQVGRLLQVLDTRSAVRYPAQALTRYGLDKPMARLTIEDQRFDFGAFNTTTREQYVLAGDSVYLIALGAGAALPRDAEALLARELFAPGEAPVRIELPEFTAILQDGTWQLNPPTDASADDRVAWAEAWQRASALRAERYDGALPGPFVRVTLKSGPTVTLGLIQREPEVVMVRSDEGIAYRFVQGAAKRLLSAPGAARQ